MIGDWYHTLTREVGNYSGGDAAADFGTFWALTFNRYSIGVWWARFFEDMAEIGRVVIPAAGRNIIQLEIVISQQMLGSVNPDLGEITAEVHVPVGLKQTREVVGSDAKMAGDGVAGFKIPIKATIFRFPPPSNA